jgi:hypothetical protein
MSRNEVRPKEDSPLIAAAAAELAAVRELTFEMDGALYTEPAPTVHAVAKILLGVEDLRARLAGLAAILEDSPA